MTDLEPLFIDTADGFDVEGSNQSGMRARNERLVLSILRRQGPLPKVEIARTTGLSAQTVSVIMRSLEQDGLLTKGQKMRGKIGQPSVPMGLAPDGAYFFGLKVGRRSAELILVNFIGQTLAHITKTYAYPTPAMTLDFVKTSVHQIIDGLDETQKERIAGMGVATPFFLWEWASVIGADDVEMAAWKDYDLRSQLANIYDFPIYLGNDASCACGAELVFGDAATPADFLYIYVGHFIGGGVVLNGSLYTGTSGNAGAIGPFPIPNATNKDQQLVDAASLIGLERRVVDAHGDVTPMINANENWDIDEALIKDWIEQAAPAIAHSIVGAISIIDFPVVLIDGNMPTDLRTQIVKAVTNAMDGMNLSGLIAPKILEGTIGARARPLGAASLPLSKRFMVKS